MIKDKKRAKEKNKKLERNQIRLNRVLALLGVSNLHKKLYRPLREHLVHNPDPPMMAYYEGSKGTPEPSKDVPEPIKEVLGWWTRATYKGMSSAEFVEVLRPLLRVMHSAKGEEALTVPDEGSLKIDQEFIDQYWKPAREYLDFFQDEFRSMFIFLTWHGTCLDTRYTRPILKWDRVSNQRLRTRIQIKSTPAQSSYFAGRWNYRVGCQMKSVTGIPEGEVQWLSQSPVALGLPGREDEQLPVYMSSHALARMRERLDCFEPRILITPCTYLSMASPVAHPLKYAGESGDSLVEFRVMNSGVKGGYFVVSRTEKEIFIKTFLFLTMQSTPEGQLLHKRLRMARPDFDFHKLEKYSTFKNTDITTHPALVPIWDQCGFTDFIKWIRTGHQPGVIQEMGDEMARYFRLQSPGMGS